MLIGLRLGHQPMESLASGEIFKMEKTFCQRKLSHGESVLEGISGTHIFCFLATMRWESYPAISSTPRCPALPWAHSRAWPCTLWKYEAQILLFFLSAWFQAICSSNSNLTSMYCVHTQKKPPQPPEKSKVSHIPLGLSQHSVNVTMMIGHSSELFPGDGYSYSFLTTFYMFKTQSSSWFVFSAS